MNNDEDLYYISWNMHGQYVESDMIFNESEVRIARMMVLKCGGEFVQTHKYIRPVTD